MVNSELTQSVLRPLARIPFEGNLQPSKAQVHLSVQDKMSYVRVRGGKPE